MDVTKINQVLFELINTPQEMDGLSLLSKIADNIITVSFFDPQYRGILDKMSYGNEGQLKEKRRSSLKQMDDTLISQFIAEIARVLKPSGHLFLWIDKFHLCNGSSHWFENTDLSIVDLIVWEKHRIGMGYRTRNKCEFLLVTQKKPTKAKGIWKSRKIPNIIKEHVITKLHPHSKPVHLQKLLIETVSEKNDLVLDPAMGSGSVFEACKLSDRSFIGGDIKLLKNKI